MIYSDLMLNRKNWDRISQTWCRGKLPHALLFHGPAGTGKEGHAIELAALLNCSSPEGEFACGNCSSCLKIRSFQHEYVKLILPLPRGKISGKEDPEIKAFSSEKSLQNYRDLLKQKSVDPYFPVRVPDARTILINSVREIKHDISLSTLNNDWRVILIFQAEKLCIPSPAAAHALLKVLEEPPEQTLFILVSSLPTAILDTIHSRCQSLYFPPISTQHLTDHLVQNGSDPVQAAVVTRISGGNIGLCKELIADSNDMIIKLADFINACFSEDPSTWEKSIDTTSRLKTKDINQMEQLFRCAVLFFRDLLYYSQTGTDEGVIFKNQLGKIDKITHSFPQADWTACIQHVEAAQTHITRNGYLPLQITGMILDIQKSIQGEFHQPFQIQDWTPV